MDVTQKTNKNTPKIVSIRIEPFTSQIDVYLRTKNC